MIDHIHKNTHKFLKEKNKLIIMIMIMMILYKSALLLPFLVAIVLVRRFLTRTSLFYIAKKHFRSFRDCFYAFQFYKIPKFNENLQENQLFRKVSVYIHSLPTVEDSDFSNLFTGNKSNEINVLLDANQTVTDVFLGARVTWTNQVGTDGERTLVLKVRRNDKRRILRPYLQHIHTVFDEIEQVRKEVKLYVNCESEPLMLKRNGRWRSVPFTHPSTIENIAMDLELKNKVKSDLETFLKSKQYYHRLGRVWKRSYLLYGSSGTGKSSFIAAMARILCYDVYDVDLSRVTDDCDLKMLLMQTTNKSMIVVEDLDRFLIEKSTSVSLSGVLNFMDGIVSCCGEERVIVFTMNDKDHVDQDVLRPGRIDVHIHFPLCDFLAFKTLANSHLGLKDHKLFPQVEEIFQSGASLTPAEIGEIMISNRSSPSRALKSVITALQTNGNIGRGGSKIPQRLSNSASGRGSEESTEPEGVICRESVHTVREFRKLYGLLRMRSSRKEEPPLDLSLIEKEGSRHGS